MISEAWSLDSPEQAWFWMKGIGHYKIQRHYYESPEGRPSTVVFFTLAGRAKYQWGDQTYMDLPGSVTLLPPTSRLISWATAENDWECYWMVLIGKAPFQWAQQFKLAMPQWSQPVSVNRQQELIERFESLLSIARPGSWHSRLAVQRDAFLLFTSILETLLHSSFSPSNARIYGRDLIAEIEAYLDRPNPKPDRVEDFAKRIHASPEHIARVLKSKTGFTPKEYFFLHRMRQAKQLLRETALPINKVGALVAYPDPYHFSKCFCRHVGVSPTQYRKRGAEI